MGSSWICIQDLPSLKRGTHVPVDPGQSWLAQHHGRLTPSTCGPQEGSKNRKLSVGHSTLFHPTKGIHILVCVCGHGPNLHVQIESTSCPLGPLGLGVCTSVALSALWETHLGAAHTRSGRGLGLFGQGVLGCYRDLEHVLEAKALALNGENPLSRGLLKP